MLLLAACASGGGGPGDEDAGRLDAARADARVGDAGRDGGPRAPDSGVCGTEICALFQYCDSGHCRDYPSCAGDGSCPRPNDVCRSGRCVPRDADVDGDGSPAGEDCDETNPMIHPGAREACNNVDDDCNMMTDEGNAATLCERDPVGGVCMAGVCGCPPNTYDVDRDVPGCECNSPTPFDQGLACDQPINLGEIADNGGTMTVSGNVLPTSRSEVWYLFRGTDLADTNCDNFHVRVQFITNPADEYELMVFRGPCDGAVCADGTFTDFAWATDFRASVSTPEGFAGQCPCWTGTPVDNVSQCADDSADFHVRVRRRAAATASCDPYTIEFSNGVYDTP
jgi:hypothetical protein